MNKFFMRILALALVVGIQGTSFAQADVLRKGNGPEVESLDPHRVEGVSAANILRDLFEGLVGEARDSSLIPGAAERWQISSDQLTYTFFLRKNARWSNGDAVTAEDFVFGLRRSVDPATGSHYSQILSPIENAEAVIEGKLPASELGVRALDDRTLQIRLKGPTPYFLGLLVHSSAYPVHKASVSELGSAFAQPGNLVSNGAYRLEERVLQSHISLKRNVYYWDDQSTTIEEVRYINTEDTNSEFKRFRAGELDWTSAIPASQIAWSRENLPDQFQSSTYLGVYYFGFNTSKPPLDDPKLRQALSYAIDRRVITDKVTQGGEQPAAGWVPPGVDGHRPAAAPWKDWSREQAIAEARRLYAEAGYSRERPARIEIRYNTSEDHKRIATVIAAMWKQWLGVETTLINEEWKVYLQNRRLREKTRVFRAGWIGDYNDANTFLEILHSEHGLNDTGYSSRDYDRLLDAASVEADPERRANLQKQAEAILLQDLPVLPIYFYVNKRLVSPRVKGWVGNIMDHHYTRYMRLVDPKAIPTSGD